MKHIRYEVSVFWADAWGKLQLILALSSIYTYYLGLIPIVLIPENLVYDVRWTLWEALFLFESTAMLLLLHYMPSSYWAELYSTALHLGRWELFTEESMPRNWKLSNLNYQTLPTVGAVGEHSACGGSWEDGIGHDSPADSFLSIMWTILLPDSLKINSKLDRDVAMQARKAGFSEWSPTGTVERGSMVVHGQRVYAAQTHYPAAEPGNMLHTKFYTTFANPVALHSAIVAIHITTILAQLCLLLFVYSHWSETLTIAITMFINYYILFHVMRDHFVMQKIYSSSSN